MSFRDTVRNTYEEMGDNPILKVISWIMFAGLVVAMLRIAVMNITPYFELMKLGQDENWTQFIPFIGGLLKAWSNTVNVIGAILVWGLMQSLQILWILINLDRKAHAKALVESRDFNFGSYRASTSSATSIGRSDDSYVRKMERKARRIPFFFIRWSVFLGLIAYACDAAIGLRVYPPVESWQAFNDALTLGLTTGINGDNIIQLAIMLFSFEAVTVPAIVVGQWIWTRNRD